MDRLETLVNQDSPVLRDRKVPLALLDPLDPQVHLDNKEIPDFKVLQVSLGNKDQVARLAMLVPRGKLVLRVRQVV